MSIGPSEAVDWSQRYTFSQILAQGGMGIIYLAEDKERQNALCVIKQLIKHPVSEYDHQEAVRLFRREAEVLKFLSHPGIVRLLDTHFTADGHYFLVMDYIEGKTLDQLLKNKGAFSPQATVEIAIQCCEVLEYLHNHKPPIIYRDLKPSNLMLSPEGQIVFIDFGIARAVVSDNSQAVTRVVSTGYSPPEQYYGKPESRSDLYALGATMGQLLTGEKPKPLSISTPSRLNKKVVPSLDSLIRRLTASSVADRPSSAQYVRYELYHIYHELDTEFVIPDEAKLIDWQKENNSPEPFKEPILNRLWRAFSPKR